jgi:PAS domain S-box-containing protein
VAGDPGGVPAGSGRRGHPGSKPADGRGHGTPGWPATGGRHGRPVGAGRGAVRQRPGPLEKATRRIAHLKANARVLLDTSPQAYFLLAPDFTIIKYNAVAAYYVKRVWNREVSEGTSMLALSNPEDLELFMINFSRALAGQHLRFDRPITYPNGLQLWYQVQYVPVYDESGRVEAVAFTALDITERKQNEQTLEKLSLVARKTDNIVIITDAAGITEWVNEGFTRVTGYSLEEARGLTPGALLQGPDSDPATVVHMRECIARGQGFQVEIINYRKDGTPYWLYISVSPIHDEAGQLTGLLP